MVFEKSKWIWNDGLNEQDCYAEFAADFFAEKTEDIIFRISCDSAFAAFLNGKLVGFSACADYPEYKFFDEISLKNVSKGKNALKIEVWHYGVDSQTYIKDDAGVIFEVAQDDKVLAFSDKCVLSRKMTEYKNGYKKIITGQLGFSFLFDNTAKISEFSESVIVEKRYSFVKRPILPLEIGERLPITVIKREKSVLIDLGREVAGFLDIEISSERKQKILIAYGEHIADGGVRRIIGDRDFSAEFIAASGKNSYINPFRRLAGRYLEIFSDYPIEIFYVGLRPVTYPVKRLEKKFSDGLLQKIYDVSVDTLALCMHEHYEDCPWREQALYSLDSRNQMLCGYYAFENMNKTYARHNLVLISKGIRKDGLLSLCFPAGNDVPIPFFSLMYIVAVSEYISYTKDVSILEEVGDALKKIFGTFSEKIDDNGLIAAFPYPYWNFYEWAEESNNEWQIGRKSTDVYIKSYDLILNCAYVYAAKYYCKLFSEDIDLSEMKESIRKTFYNGNDFKLSTLTEKSSQLGNSFAILIGIGDEALAKRIISDENTVKATLSMKAFVYDALLSFGDGYADYILNDIRRSYKNMLDAGATSFWETENGEADFDGAGSLCHGWSAMPVYYLNLISHLQRL